MPSNHRTNPRAKFPSSNALRNMAEPGSAAAAGSLRKILAQASVVLLVTAAAACSDDVGEVDRIPSTGGHVGSGGSAASGGSQVGSGGSGNAGAQVSSGGSQASSGGSATAPRSGGTSGSGGVATGGVSGTGGTITGGATGTSGGATGTGGRTVGMGGSSAGRGGTGSGGQDGGAGNSGRDAGGRGGQAGGSRPDGGPGGSTGAGGSPGTTFNPCTAGAACKIMPLGDSITEGYGASGKDGGGPANQGGYRIELFRQTVKNSKNITFVGSLTNGPTTVENKTFPKNHEGHGGWTISQIAGIADNTLSTNKPNIVLLKIGTNDVNGSGASSAPTGLKNLIDQITKDAPSALLVVSSIIPIKDDNTNPKVKTYNATIPTAVNAAAAAGKHVVFADSYAAFAADSSWKTKYMSDNLHPNDTGYALLGQTWYGAISSVLP